jgi:hypothetical protein
MHSQSANGQRSLAEVVPDAKRGSTMVTKTPYSPGALTHEERAKWWGAYLTAAKPLLGSNLSEIAITGVVHLCADWAWLSLEAYRKAVLGEQS